ncbi:multiple epidermal growth factor-like domains protein 10 isoform X1 [Dreissena polymorpha]|uniref:EGF-like domain-containing protein n=1 Tax=Dreissena polymorpha TaxID=45954 RepID=A0A9D4CKI6_DREPO|nr:multiple epidermal growth factor-like domains protein 10 isoform X1 [Dreissena polymorpha]KAH3727053.1 hypothetical protein DPMN_052979 [Dreissena polymorpha]
MASFLCYIYSIFIFVRASSSLTGHVCSRLRAETYQTTYDRAFICPERYTTACGQLDWRRCTKYRVSTCYSPTEKYALRYTAVEECCIGWRDAGDGDCSVPVCEGRCENGGHCVASGTIPECSCPEGYNGDRCQNDISPWKWSHLTVGALVVVIALVAISLLVFFYCQRRKRNTNHSVDRITLKELDREHKKRLIDAEPEDEQTSASLSGKVSVPETPREPSAPLEED